MNQTESAKQRGNSAQNLNSADWWHKQDARVVCDLCPRHCALKEGDYGFCFVRQNIGGRLVLNTYGRSTGFCIDPVEKKPLNHFFPGTSVLSFGTAGCNMGCKFCQAWEITKSKQVLDRLSQQATPEMIAEAAVRLGCHSVAFTYNDPVIWAEYAIDTAIACHDRGLKTIAVTAGFICPEPRKSFFEVMDATNVDLKGFTEHFYRHLTLSHLEPVLDTLRWIKHESSVWLEITNLVIPGANDDPAEIRQMCEWIRTNSAMMYRFTSPRSIPTIACSILHGLPLRHWSMRGRSRSKRAWTTSTSATLTIRSDKAPTVLVAASC